MEDDIMAKVPMRCVPNPSAPYAWLLSMIVQQPSGEALQGVRGVRAPTADALLAGGRMVHERDARHVRRLARDDPPTDAALAVHASRTSPSPCYGCARTLTPSYARRTTA